ncbi:DUF1289 domain-containing protein [Paraburkholderia phosphatilytica]|uniref:DUF1289 domain-containing protein n=1 Tax=Paraburkholderia phosphatilytica TaxID=2282883 RepID=UPI001980B13B|nr:DUF1289 domain-containing protein [Paraburkholderia phosphatilytica]
MSGGGASQPTRRPQDMTPVPSPCIDICRMDASTGLCEGCLRTIDEIANWSTFDDDAKRAVWNAIDARHAAWLESHR